MSKLPRGHVQYSMIVAKFGGTAVTPRNLIHLKQIVTPAHGAVVVSAIGREFKTDVKVTDLLLSYFATGDEALWSEVAARYLRLAEVNGISATMPALLQEVHARARTQNAAYCASVGEELSARAVAAFLGLRYVEAEQAVRFDSNGQLLRQLTYTNIRSAFEGGPGVMGGFYGGCDGGGRCTFSRGGGDVSGAIVAAALNAELYENWTDVNGVCVANPVQVHNAATVDGLSYAQMRLLSAAGAEVLHPDAILPCEQRSIPIRIGNFFDPAGRDTLITHCPNRNRVLSIAERPLGGRWETTLLHSFPTWQIAAQISGFLRSQTGEMRFFGSVRPIDPGIEVRFGRGIVRLTSPNSLICPLYKALVRG